jgi:predicted nucleic acid-binding protein
MWIAASAMQYGLTVVTTDAHFLTIPQILVSHTLPAK